MTECACATMADALARIEEREADIDGMEAALRSFLVSESRTNL